MLYEIAALVSASLAASLALTTIWSRRETWVRGAAVALFMSAIMSAYAPAFFALSHPAPLQAVEMVTPGKYSVLGMKMIRDQGIYLWIDKAESDHPLYTVLPWSDRMAEKLQELQRQAKRRGAPFGMEVPKYEFSWETREPPMFYPAPQPQAPLPKPALEPEIYERGA